MLKALEIENIAVIEKASMEFKNGFNVLTGETGAGKSIIIDSVNAVLGLRTSRELVRTGASHALIIAEFTQINKSVSDLLFKNDIDEEPDSLILQRRISADGKSSCRVNGKPVTASLMKEIGSLLVNIHGQHDNQKLLNSEKHYRYIDRLINDDKLLEQYALSYKELCYIIREINKTETDEGEKQRIISRLRYEIDEIEKAHISPGEIESLKKEKDFLNSIDRLNSALEFVKYSLYGDDNNDGALGITGAAEIKLQNIEDEMTEKLKSYLSDAVSALSAAGEETRDIISSLDINSHRIDEVEERLNLYYGFSNKYGKTENEILNYLSAAKKQLHDINFEDEYRKRLNEEFEQKKDMTYNLALKLSEKRKAAAKIFEQKIEDELHFLDMPNARFKVEFGDSPICKKGIDEIRFLISVNAGEELKPLANVASGGELSRIMLALRNVLGQKESVPTLIFDEIDTGVSGRAAEKVGLKLKEVGRSAQVLCITHLAQIASMASTHFLIHKSVTDGRTFTNVKLLSFEGRKYEIARIMGGSNISNLLLQNAEAMLRSNQDDTV